MGSSTPFIPRIILSIVNKSRRLQEMRLQTKAIAAWEGFSQARRVGVIGLHLSLFTKKNVNQIVLSLLTLHLFIIRVQNNGS